MVDAVNPPSTNDTRAPGFFQGLPATPAAVPATAARARRPAAPPPTPVRVALAAPWADPTKWDEITIAGITFTGKVDVDGDALKPKTDHHRARGSNNGRSVAVGHDKVDFSVTLGAFPEDPGPDEDLHIQEMDAIYARLADESPTRQGSSAFPVSYPSLAFARISMATVESITLPKYDADSGMVLLTIKFKSWKEPVARTVRAATTPTETPLSQDPALVAARANGTLAMVPIDRGPRLPDPPSRSGAAAPR